MAFCTEYGRGHQHLSEDSVLHCLAISHSSGRQMPTNQGANSGDQTGSERMVLPTRHMPPLAEEVLTSADRRLAVAVVKGATIRSNCGVEHVDNGR